MALPITEYPQYFTATNLLPMTIGRQKLLKPEKYKDIIISSLRFLVKDKRAKIFAFVIMDNHIHSIWQMMPDNDPEAVQRDFLKYTAQRIRKDLQMNHPKVLEYSKVEAKDREYLPIAIGIGKEMHWVSNWEDMKYLSKNWNIFIGHRESWNVQIAGGI